MRSRCWRRPFVNGGSAQESVVGAGSIIWLRRTQSVLSSNVVVDDGAIVEGSVIMRAPAWARRGGAPRDPDKNVVVGPGEMVGVDLEKDRDRFAISAGEWSPWVRALDQARPCVVAGVDRITAQTNTSTATSTSTGIRIAETPARHSKMSSTVEHRRGHPGGGDVTAGRTVDLPATPPAR
jgi:hypothetical protein